MKKTFIKPLLCSLLISCVGTLSSLAMEEIQEDLERIPSSFHYNHHFNQILNFAESTQVNQDYFDITVLCANGSSFERLCHKKRILATLKDPSLQEMYFEGEALKIQSLFLTTEQELPDFLKSIHTYNPIIEVLWKRQEIEWIKLFCFRNYRFLVGSFFHFFQKNEAVQGFQEIAHHASSFIEEVHIDKKENQALELKFLKTSHQSEKE